MFVSLISAVLLLLASDKNHSVDGLAVGNPTKCEIANPQSVGSGLTPGNVDNKGRRNFMSDMLLMTTGGSLLLLPPSDAHAVITDETSTFADNWWDTATTRSTTSSNANNIPTDEVVISVSKQDLVDNKGLGIEVGEIEFKTNLRVYIKSVRPDSLASKLGIQQDWIVVAINGDSTERTNAEGVAIMVSRAVKNSESDTIQFRFRDPSQFRQQLNSMNVNEPVTTQVAPAGDTTQRNTDGSVRMGRSVTEQADQRVTVEQLIAPKLCRRPATTDDLLEISYLGTVVETGMVFDGSAIKINGEGIPGRGDDVSLFFVLGKQPFGQFPPGWDVGLYGMCVGERRRLIIPPALAYGSVGMKRRGIPPDATLQYDVTLVSINGLATPQ